MDLCANELWVVVPTDTFLARLPDLSPKVQEGAPIVLWRGLVRAQTAEPPQHTACRAHGTRTVHAWCTRGVRVLGRRRTMAGTCATVGGSYRPSGSPRARPRCFGTRSLRRCTPRRCNAAGSECLGSQRPVAAQRSRCPLTCSGPPSGPKPRFGDCRLHSVSRLAEPGPRRRWARMRLPRCNDTTPSARRRNPRPAWS